MMLDGIMKHLPEDIAMHILLRFPVKSLLRFKFISKSWFTLIESSTFINIHLNRATTTKNEFLLFSRSYREETEGFKNVLSILSSDNNDELIPVVSDLELPYLTFTEYYLFNKLVGPCNGLIVLTDFDIIVLINPATKNYMLIPPSPFVCPKGFHRSFRGGVGFGFDSIVKDYKFVTISEVFMDSEWVPDEKEQKVEVYDLRFDSWRDLNHVDQQLPTVYYYPCFEMLYNGAFHWYAINDRLDHVILSFDISTEIFHSIKMPATGKSSSGKKYGLIVLNESLTLICYPNPDCEMDPSKDSMDIWIMMEYGIYESWTKKYIIKPLPIESPLTIWRDHLLLLQSKSGLLVSYDLSSNEVKEFDLHGYPKSLRVLVYKESLISIPKRGCKHGTKFKNC
uniref:S10-locus linked F-box protein type-8 n=1 Tax=Petunia hybrida TaxID=4102 RepID=A0A140JNK7_PETHY|nr:S10-locus linked F-box protein type-8 [Petunia x hybrida]